MAKYLFFKTASTPPPPNNCTSPNKKRDQFQPFPNITDCHTKHIAMLHGLWPSEYNGSIKKMDENDLSGT